MKARHSASQSFERKVTFVLLVIGTIVSVALAFGPVWMVRIGVGVSIAMAFASVLMAWRELDKVTAAHRAELKTVLALSMEASNRQHKEALEMIDRFDARTAQLQATIKSVSHQLAAAHNELATMRGNNVWLRGEVSSRQARVDALEAQLAELEAQAMVEGAEVLNLPRYGVASNHHPELELWADGDHPTVVDMAALAFPEPIEVRKHA